MTELELTAILAAILMAGSVPYGDDRIESSVLTARKLIHAARTYDVTKIAEAPPA